MKKLVLSLVCLIAALSLISITFSAKPEIAKCFAEQTLEPSEVTQAGYRYVPPPIYHPTPYYHYHGGYHRGGPCFIATAAYEDPNHAYVKILQEFRDRWLMTNRPGQAFVGFYYENGPHAARFVQEHTYLKPAIRAVLLPVIGFAYVLNAIGDCKGG